MDDLAEWYDKNKMLIDTCIVCGLLDNIKYNVLDESCSIGVDIREFINRVIKLKASPKNKEICFKILNNTKRLRNKMLLTKSVEEIGSIIEITCDTYTEGYLNNRLNKIYSDIRGEYLKVRTEKDLDKVLFRHRIFNVASNGHSAYINNMRHIFLDISTHEKFNVLSNGHMKLVDIYGIILYKDKKLLDTYNINNCIQNIVKGYKNIDMVFVRYTHNFGSVLEKSLI